MKIAFIPSTFLPSIGGAEIQTHNFANKLIEEGHEVEIMLLNKISVNNGNYKIFQLNKFLISFVFLFKYYFNLNFTFLLKLYFKKIIFYQNYDIWHFHSVNYKTLIYIEVLKKLNQKVMVTLQGADIQIDHEIGYGYRLDKKYDNYIKKVFQKVDCFQAISISISKELLNFDIEEKKINIIPNCSHYEKISTFKKTKEEKLTMLTIGRYAEKKKGFDLVVKVAEELKKITEFRWIIIGRNSNTLLQNQFIKKNLSNFEIVNQIENNDETYFPHSNLIEYYKKSHVYVNLSRVEGSPLVVIDAISSNLPIITFNTRGGDEIVLDGHNGFIVDNFDFKQFANKIFKLKEFTINKEEELIKNHINKFDLFLNTKKIVDLYKSII